MARSMTRVQLMHPEAPDIHPVDAHVGARLRTLRRELGFVQQAVGVKVGVSFQQLQKYAVLCSKHTFNGVDAAGLGGGCHRIRCARRSADAISERAR